MNAIKEFQTLIERALESSSSQSPSSIVYWDGSSKNFGQPPYAVKIIIKSQTVLKDMLKDLSLGFGEHYMDDAIEIEGNFQDVLKLEQFIKTKNFKIPLETKATIAIYKVSTINFLKKAKSNISHHYDLGNNFFSLFLDKSMTYSCAYFRSENDTLENAQMNKYELISRKIDLKDGDRVVDIGCGFGGFLIYAAKRNDIKAVGCTISKNQYEYAKAKVEQEGLSKKIEILFEDYRKLKGSFSKFVSIGAYEHIGKNYAHTFFKKLNSILEDNAVGLLHTIGHNRPQKTDPWTLKYIFPGGYLPSLEELVKNLRRVGFYIWDIENLRSHYAKTIEYWIDRFEKNIDNVKQMFDDRFIRMWHLYLNGACASFKWGETQLYQIVFTKNQTLSYPCHSKIY